MLLRMYLRAAESAGQSVIICDQLAGAQGGLKRVLLELPDAGSFGRLAGESGVHRIQHTSRFGASSRRQTSFARVIVRPLRERAGRVALAESDLDEEMIRSRGPGGQHVNKTATAVRLTHRPSGVVVRVESERSQAANRERARRILAGRLAEQADQAAQRERAQERDGADPVAFGAQCRTYTIWPYQLCTDHRRAIKHRAVDEVLDGDLGPFLRPSWIALGKEAVASQGSQ